MAKKKTRNFLYIVAGVLAAVAIWNKFLRTDKMGGRMSLDDTPAGGNNVLYNGNKISGWLKPGTLRLLNGYWTGNGEGTDVYQYRNGSFVKLA
jgi:hypothetical protein